MKKKSTRKISIETSTKLVTFLKNLDDDKRIELFKELFLKHGVELKLNPVGMLVVKASKPTSEAIYANLQALNKAKGPITFEGIYNAIVSEKEVVEEPEEELDPDSTQWTHIEFREKSGNTISIKPKTENQQLLVNEILNKKVIFANGASGTGKTMISVCVALKLLEKKAIKKIWITRPNLPSESFGFLPGNIDEKMLPFFLPIYNIIDNLIGKDRRVALIEKGSIEILPVAFARGMNIGTTQPEILIVDESENLTLKQMFLMLSRIGADRNSKIILSGDSYQSDLGGKDDKSLVKVEKILKGLPSVAFITFNKNDVVRSKEVQEIVERFEKYEEDKNKK